jgi:parallel beta-helix repeat protein
MKRIITALMVATILLSALVMAFDIQPVKAIGTIHIRADGSIDPPTAPIHTEDNVNYVLTGDITSDDWGIIIERNNIIIDGNGCTLQGSGSGPAFYLHVIDNVTVRSIDIRDFASGFYLGSVSLCTIFGNTITNCQFGVRIEGGSDNTFSENTITNSQNGVSLSGGSNNNTFFRNTIANIRFNSVTFANCKFNTFSANTIRESSVGVFLDGGSSNNYLSENTITNSQTGVYLYSSSNNNIVFGNTITNSTNCGVSLRSSNNIVYGNTIAESYCGVYLDSVGNEIYHNNFINYKRPADTRASAIWDYGYPSGGNYWSDYTDVDDNSGPYQNITGVPDGIWDHPYVINVGNVDRYPLKLKWHEVELPVMTVLSPEDKTYAVSSDIPLTFRVDKPADWIGYSLNGQAKVTIAGNATLPTLPDGPHYVVVYANDTYGNMGASNMVHFTVDTTTPVADAGADQEANEGTLVAFDGSASSDNIAIAKFKWAFIDGTDKILTGQKSTYAFNTPGTYTVTLNVTDTAENWDTDTVTITVIDSTEPVANTGQDRTADVGTAVSFDAGASTDNVGIVSYEWDFGDGSEGTGKTATHAYTSAGEYTVTLTVKDAAGNQATDTMKIAVAGGIPTWVIAAAGVTATAAIAAIAALYYLRRRKP